ncbi:MAG: hypothetical protein ACRD3S_05630, partial [Terracidiphilus sp.]
AWARSSRVSGEIDTQTSARTKKGERKAWFFIRRHSSASGLRLYRAPELRLTVEEIPQVPGYRRRGRKNQSVSESLFLTGEIVPVALLNPFVAAAIATDSLVWGRYPLPLRQARVLSPRSIEQLATSRRLTDGPYEAALGQ